MIFADKLIQLRKKSGWSQEELAEQMQVTRQAVSKWESAQSVPDLEKMVRLSNLFGVSTDYLLKDDITEVDPAAPQEDSVSTRCVTMEEASAFLEVKQATVRPIALAVLLCILSPVCLLVLAGLSDARAMLSENLAAGIGLIVLLGMVATAVALFMASGAKTAPYAHLQKEPFETAYGVSGMVRQRQAAYRDTYMRGCILGVTLCILAVIPIFISLLPAEVDGLLPVLAVCVTLVLAGLGVMVLLRVGIPWASYETLLQEGDYTRQRKAREPLRTGASVAFWLTATAIYLAISLTTNRWDTSWIVWPVAGVLYPALLAVINGWKR